MGLFYFGIRNHGSRLRLFLDFFNQSILLVCISVFAFMCVNVQLALASNTSDEYPATEKIGEWYDTFAYDSNGRAIVSELGQTTNAVGQQRVELSY